MLHESADAKKTLHIYPIWIIFLFEWLRICMFFSSLLHFGWNSSSSSFLQFKSHSEFLWIHRNEVKHSGMTLIVFFFLSPPSDIRESLRLRCFFAGLFFEESDSSLSRMKIGVVSWTAHSSLTAFIVFRTAHSTRHNFFYVFMSDWKLWALML